MSIRYGVNDLRNAFSLFRFVLMRGDIQLRKEGSKEQGRCVAGPRCRKDLKTGSKLTDALSSEVAAGPIRTFKDRDVPSASLRLTFQPRGSLRRPSHCLQ